jgi:hypothetical protein
MDMRRWKLKAVAATAAVTLMGGCSDGVGVGGLTQLSLNFRVAGSGVPAAALAQADGPARVAGPPMILPGTNGTLTLDEIRVIINEVELKRADPSCDSTDNSGPGSDDDSGEDCGEFEAGPRFLDLPLDGEPIEAVTALIPAGTYKELDFEIEDLEDDEDDAVEAALIAAVRSDILAEISDWPREASAMVTGTFAPAGGGPSVDFRVFIEAEIEIEMELIPNLVIDETGAASRELTVDVSPRIWFTNPDGTVLELQNYDFDSTGEVLEFEVEMENGFTEIEFDD